MSEKQASTSSSSNCSDSEESCALAALKLCDETPACKAESPGLQQPNPGAADGKSQAGQCGGNTATALGAGLCDGLEKLLQKQRSDLLFELRRLQHGDRPVTNTDRRETLEEFFSDALLRISSHDQPHASLPRRQVSRPDNILSEVQGLSERRPVTSVLGSQSFRRNLEDVIRGSLVRQDHELQRAIRLRAAGFNVGNSRTAPPVDHFQQQLESLSQLSHSSQTSSSSHQGLADMSAFLPPPPPPPPPPHFQQPPLYQPWQQQSAQTWQQQPSQPWQQQPLQPWQQQPSQTWRQQQQPSQTWQQQPSQTWQPQSSQPWQQAVQPQQPWLMQNSAVPQSGRGNVDMVAYLQHAQREEAVFEISDLVQRQVVSTMLNSNFRGTLENTMMAHLQQTESDGMSVQNFVQSLRRSSQHRRNDFGHLGIHGPAVQQTTMDSAGGPATRAGPEMELIQRQLNEMQTMLRLTFELQMDMQRSIRQEVAAALGGQNVPGATNQVPIPPSRPASEGSCVICLEKSVDAVLYQCGHMCCCINCGLRLKGMGSHCPMCRAPIRDVIRAYRCQKD